MPSGYPFDEDGCRCDRVTRYGRESHLSSSYHDDREINWVDIPYSAVWDTYLRDQDILWAVRQGRRRNNQAGSGQPLRRHKSQRPQVEPEGVRAQVAVSRA